MKNNSGITLIALGITMVILLIIAAISVTTLSGDNSLINEAEQAKEDVAIKNEKDIINQAVTSAMNNSIFGEVEESLFRAALSGNSQISSIEKVNNTIQVTFNSGRTYKVNIDGEVREKTVLKVGDTDLSTVSDISTMYGETTSYKSTSHPDIDWQLFYEDSNNYYVIASDYVPNAELPCNGNTGFGATDLIKSTSTESQRSTYCAEFCSSSYSDGVLTTGTIYKNGSASTAITGNPLTSTYLKWANTYNTSTNTNICSVAYMMDTNKWSSFADGVNGAYAIGGPTIEMFVNSYNAVSTHTTKLGTYETVDSNNSNSNGYMTKLGTSSWVSEVKGLDKSGTDGNMWVRTRQTKAYAYWLASPSSDKDAYCVRCVSSSGYVSYSYADIKILGFRPLVVIQK